MSCFDSMTAPLHIAHRGGALLYPENTMFAFEAAVQTHRTDMLELDVHLSRDGRVVVWHDDTLDRCSDGTGSIAERSWAELRGLDAGYRFTPDGGASFPFRGKGIRPCLLSELLEAFPALPLNIEVKSKDPALCAAFAEVVRAHDAAGRICCGSEHDAVGERLYDALPEATHFYPLGPGAMFVLTVLKGGTPPLDPRYTVLDIPESHSGLTLVTPRLMEVAAETGRTVNVWTIDEADDMKRLLDMGVFGIMTDRPDRLRSVIDARAGA